MHTGECVPSRIPNAFVCSLCARVQNWQQTLPVQLSNVQIELKKRIHDTISTIRGVSSSWFRRYLSFPLVLGVLGSDDGPLFAQALQQAITRCMNGNQATESLHFPDRSPEETTRQTAWRSVIEWSFGMSHPNWTPSFGLFQDENFLSELHNFSQHPLPFRHSLHSSHPTLFLFIARHFYATPCHTSHLESLFSQHDEHVHDNTGLLHLNAKLQFTYGTQATNDNHALLEAYANEHPNAFRDAQREVRKLESDWATAAYIQQHLPARLREYDEAVQAKKLQSTTAQEKGRKSARVAREAQLKQLGLQNPLDQLAPVAIPLLLSVPEPAYDDLVSPSSSSSSSSSTSPSSSSSSLSSSTSSSSSASTAARVQTVKVKCPVCSKNIDAANRVQHMLANHQREILQDMDDAPDTADAEVAEDFEV